jgi:hypothetical protein
MIESAKPNNGVPLEVLIRNDAVPLESILCTEELRRRPSRPPDYKKENRALVTLATRWSTRSPIFFRHSPRRSLTSPSATHPASVC